MYQYILVHANKAQNNIDFICKAHQINYILEEPEVNFASCNPYYTHMSLSKEDIFSTSYVSFLQFNNFQNSQQ